MTNKEILDFLREAGKPVWFRQMANWFPGDSEEAELFRRVRFLVECGYIRRLKNGMLEVAG